MCISNFPVKMILKSALFTGNEEQEVFVYDFIHNTYAPLDSNALCWNPKTEIWLTVPIASLTPIIAKEKSRLLKESLNNNSSEE